MEHHSKCNCGSDKQKQCSCTISLGKNEVFNKTAEGIARQPEAAGRLMSAIFFITNFIEAAKSVKTCGDKSCLQDLCKMDEALLDSGMFTEAMARQPEAAPMLYNLLIAKALFYYNYFVLSKCCYDKKELTKVIASLFNKLIAKYDPDPNAVCCQKEYLKIECGIIFLNECIDFSCFTDPFIEELLQSYNMFKPSEIYLEKCELKRFFIYLLGILRDDCNRGRYPELIGLTTKTVDYLDKPVDGVSCGRLLTKYYNSDPNNLCSPGLSFSHNPVPELIVLNNLPFLINIYKNINTGLSGFLNNFVNTHQCCKPKEQCNPEPMCDQPKQNSFCNSGRGPSYVAPLVMRPGCGCNC